MHGKPFGLRSPSDAIGAGIGFVPEDRKRSAILPTRSVQQNLSVAWLRRLSRLGLIDLRRRSGGWRRTRCAASRSRPRRSQAKIVQLSGGNQQKVVLGRWFALSPDVIVLSEPTRGIDVGAKSEVYGLIQDMADRRCGRS